MATPCLLTCLLWIASLHSLGSAYAQGLRGFGAPPGKLPARGFGDPSSEEQLRLQYPNAAISVTGNDRYYAQRQLDKADANKDGIVTLQEWIDDKQSPDLFLEKDLDGDGVLTIYENTLRWTMARTKIDKNKQVAEKAMQARSLASVHKQPVIAFNPNEKIAALGDQTRRLAGYLVDRYDANNNKVIDRTEFASTRSSYGNLAAADFDHDGQATQREVARWLMQQIKDKEKVGLPAELRERDIDEDGQLTLIEYTPELSADMVQQFEQLDRNGDGLLTPRESQSSSPESLESSTTFRLDRASVLLGNAVLISEIQVVDDIPIANLDVRVELSKDDDSFVDMFLVSPDHKSIPLFDGGWLPWRGHVFDGTVISDSAPEIRSMLPQRPAVPLLQPPGVKDESVLSLSAVNGISTKGRWRLVIRNHNDVSGLLRRWALMVTPALEQAR